jgi:polysaccharide pyruvyl transferase WcaK-like protein
VKPESVVFTITDYYKNPKYDRELIQIILQEYNCVYFFPQGIGDIAYIKTILDEITLEKIEILERSLTAFDDLLKSTVIDYVGTRLHGGIRALQNSRRAFIIAVDNRALEISKDTQLPVTHRNNLSTLSENINKNFEFTLKINRINIEKFKTNLNKFLQG